LKLLEELTNTVYLLRSCG